MRRFRGPSNADNRLDASYRNLDRAISWITNADNKALVVLAFQGAILAGLAAFGESLRSTIEHQRAPCLPLSILLVLACFLFSFCVSLWQSFRTLFPDITPRDAHEAARSPFFFGTISHMSLGEFSQRIRSLDDNSIEEELIKQTHVVSKIAARKFRNLKSAFVFLGFEVLFLFLALAVAEVGKQG